MEETRPGQYFPICQDDRGSYIFNSKDLCMLGYLPQMADAGICALKIEGRMKSIHYVATTVKIYREALDAYANDPKGFTLQASWIEELSKVSHRGYCTGFYLNDPDQIRPNLEDLRCVGATFSGKVLSPNRDGHVWVEARNRLKPGDIVERLPQKGPVQKGRITAITDMKGHSLKAAQPVSQVLLKLDLACDSLDLLRRIDQKC